MNLNLTTILYSYYQFIGKNKPKLRHLMTPTIGYRYVPLLNPLQIANAAGWNPIFKEECVSPCVPTYQILIEPTGLYRINSYQKVNLLNTQATEKDEYLVGWKKMDDSFIDQELHLLR